MPARFFRLNSLFLIQKGADIDLREFQYKLFPLDVAQARGFMDMAELLLKNGAKP